MENELNIGVIVEFRTFGFDKTVQDFDEVIHVGEITNIDAVQDGLVYTIYSQTEGVHYIIHGDDIAGAYQESTYELTEGELPF